MLRRYKRFEARLERKVLKNDPFDDLLGNSRWTEVSAVLYDDHACVKLGFMSLTPKYTKENAVTLLQFLKVFNERVKLEVERQKLVR